MSFFKRLRGSDKANCKPLQTTISNKQLQTLTTCRREEATLILNSACKKLSVQEVANCCNVGKLHVEEATTCCNVRSPNPKAVETECE
jgi:hypothetical protein